jgi:hypothetical protein
MSRKIRLVTWDDVKKDGWRAKIGENEDIDWSYLSYCRCRVTNCGRKMSDDEILEHVRARGRMTPEAKALECEAILKEIEEKLKQSE